MTPRTVISLGGSIFVPDEIDVAFLGSFMDLIKKRIAEGEKFAIILGGGKTCRKYQQAGKELGATERLSLDWIGISVNNMHANFMRIVYQDLAYEETVTNPNIPVNTEKPVIFVGAYEPGGSSDHDAVLMAKTTGAKKIINLSNIDYVYDKDPRKNPDAKVLKSLTWDEYRKLIPAEWIESGMSTPFDPTASKQAHELGLTIAMIKGTRLDEFEKCLKGEEFDGSTIG